MSAAIPRVIRIIIFDLPAEMALEMCKRATLCTLGFSREDCAVSVPPQLVCFDDIDVIMHGRLKIL